MTRGPPARSSRSSCATSEHDAPSSGGPVASAYAANVALTRRTARFGELARAADAELARRGVDVDAAAVDAALNARVARSAQLLGVEPRAALVYAPDDVALWIADELAGTAPAGEAAPGVVIDLDDRRNGRNMI